MMHYLLSCKQLFWAKLPQESSEAFFNLKKPALPRIKKKLQRVLTEWFEKHFATKTWFHLASQKRNFLALSHLFWIPYFPGHKSNFLPLKFLFKYQGRLICRVDFQVHWKIFLLRNIYTYSLHIYTTIKIYRIHLPHRPIYTVLTFPHL